ncbi:MAG: MFS transporter, partial [Actinobacteria bacterium]|nr:MFS transporter [Actinomycetota bacterium]
MAGPPPSALVRAARLPIAVGAALALADASVVTLALPEILAELDTTVEGLAAIIGVYTVVLAAAVLVAIPARRALGSRATGALGMLLFAVASVMCGVSDGLTGLLVSRGIQAVGAAFGLLAAFELLDRGAGGGAPRHRPAALWVAAAIFGTAIGPALGGALTQAFDWRAIFLAQAPFGLLAAAACLVPQRPTPGRAGADGATGRHGSPAGDPPADGRSEDCDAGRRSGSTGGTSDRTTGRAGAER